MRIFVMDGREFCVQSHGGIRRYKIEVLSKLEMILNEDEPFEIHVLYPDDMKPLLHNFNRIRFIPVNRVGKKFALQVIPAYIRKVNGHLLDFGIAWCIPHGGVVTLHDSRMVTEKYEPFRKRAQEIIKFQYNRIASKYVVTVSEDQKNTLVKCVGIPEKKIFVVGNGWEHMESITCDNRIFDRYPQINKHEYFYAIGSQYPHKNYVWIEEVAKRNPDKQFVVAGRTINKTHIAENHNVLYVGAVTDEENKALMAYSRCFLHPSKYEGFGIPPMEALSCGTPVIASDLAVLREIYGKTIHYVDPDNFDVDLDLILSDQCAPADEVLTQYTWKNAAGKWYELLSNY